MSWILMAYRPSWRGWDGDYSGSDFRSSIHQHKNSLLGAMADILFENEKDPWEYECHELTVITSDRYLVGEEMEDLMDEAEPFVEVKRQAKAMLEEANRLEREKMAYNSKLAQYNKLKSELGL